MHKDITIAIVDTDLEHAKLLEKHIKTLNQKLAHVGTVNNLDDAKELVARKKPFVVMIELEPDKDASLAFVKETLLHHPDTYFFAMSSDSSSDTILKAIRGGCAEFMLKPVNVNDMMNAFTKFGRLMTHEPKEHQDEAGMVIACFSPKGGMGNSTVATNLAVSLHQSTEKPVVLIDLDLESGDLSMFLNIKPKYTISDVTASITKLDKAYLQGALSRHDSGIYFLSEPERVEEAEAITSAEIRQVLDLLRKMFSYVIVDTSTGYEDKNLVSFDAADLILLNGVLSLPAIHNLQKSLDVFERLGFTKDKVKLIVNRYLRKGEITVEDAQRVLDYEVFWTLPNAYNDVMSSINRGLPLSQLAPGAEITRSFKEMAAATREHLSRIPVRA